MKYRRETILASVQAIGASYAGVVLMSAFIFLAAGKFFWQGGLYLALALIGTTITHLLASQSAEQSAQRLASAPRGESWDRRLLALYFGLSLLAFVVAGIETGRFGGAHGGLSIFAGAIEMLTGQILFALARRENPFFTSTVQIAQAHVVCRTGLYGLVRHPGYLGMVLSMLAFPIVLASNWAWLPSGLAVLVLLWRTQGEDRFLHQQLADYPAYARAVPYKLVPFIF